jgi:hypothetical protein
MERFRSRDMERFLSRDLERFRSRDLERFRSRDLERFRSCERDLSRRPRDLDLLSRERDLLRPLSLGDLTGDFDSFLTSLSSLGLATSVRMYIPEKSSPVFFHSCGRFFELSSPTIV